MFAWYDLCYRGRMAFEWNEPTRVPSGEERHLTMYRQEVAERAALFYRLGYAEARAVARLRANADWDFEIGTGPRPEALSPAAIAEIVRQTYARRPAR